MAKRRGKKPDTPCSDCGKLLYSSQSSLPAGQRRCIDCRRARPAWTRRPRRCLTCAEFFTSPTSGAKYCSRDCSNRTGGARPRMGRVCEVCGSDYNASYADQRTCSRTCGEALRRHVTGTRTARPGPMHGPPAPPKPKPAPSVRVFFPYCQICGSSFATPYTVTTCGDSCADEKKKRDRQRHKDVRRARKRNAFVANVYRLRIYERDRWRCQICDKPVRRNAVAPDPLAPTLDHIVPLAVGGTHEPANCQLAHFLCNSRKAATGPAADQLRLIG